MKSNEPWGARLTSALLKKIAAAEFEDSCAVCGVTFWLEDGLEPSAICHPCADVLANRLAEEVLRLRKRAREDWPTWNSAHEGYAVLLEEVDELWAHVKTKQRERDIEAMRKEAIQVAAMALRFAIDVCNEEVGRR